MRTSAAAVRRARPGMPARSLISSGRLTISRLAQAIWSKSAIPLPHTLAARGTSVGGMAVCGFITQHPELLRAALDRVGNGDPLRFEVLARRRRQYRRVCFVKVEAEFRALYAISRITSR